MSSVRPQRFGSTIKTLLPQELVDHIIDFLHDDRATLLACTHVARAWLPSSRLHLLSDIEVQVAESHFNAFCAYVRSCEFGPQYIRRVALNGELMQHGRTRIRITQGFLVDLLTFLPRLESLHMFTTLLEPGPDSPSWGPLALDDPPQRTFQLKKLKMSYCGDINDGFSSLATCLNIFRHIGELNIRSMKIRTSLGTRQCEAFARELACALPPMDAVVIDDDAFRSELFLQALTFSSASQSLRSLDIRSSCVWSHEHLGLLLGRIGGGLRHLGLQVSKMTEPRDPALFLTQLNLSACTRLEQLSLRFDPDLFALPVALSCASIARIVDSAPCAALHTVALHSDCLFVVENATRGDNALDTALARFPALRELAVRVPRRAWTRQGDLDKIGAVWPLTAQRARVTVEYE